MKVVHEEEYKGLNIIIKATFDDERGVRLSSEDEWYMGNVNLFCEIQSPDGKTIESYDTVRSDKYEITFQRKFKRTGFLKLKKEFYIVHIADEYDRVLALFIDRVKKIADSCVDEKYRKVKNEMVTDGLPVSLKEL